MRSTKASPAVVDTLRDSLMAQMISWDATLAAVVAGLAVLAVLSTHSGGKSGEEEDSGE